MLDAVDVDTEFVPHAVTQILRRTRGSIELVDASELLPRLKRTPGLRRWRPFDKQKQAFFDTHEEARAVRMSSDSCSAALSRRDADHFGTMAHFRLHTLFSCKLRDIAGTARACLRCFQNRARVRDSSAVRTGATCR